MLVLGPTSPPASATSTLTRVVVSAISLADDVHLRLPLSSEGGGSVPKRRGLRVTPLISSRRSGKCVSHNEGALRIGLEPGDARCNDLVTIGPKPLRRR